MFNYPKEVLEVLGSRIEEFERKTARDLNVIGMWIPQGVVSVLDIGAGLAAIDVLVWKIRGHIREINIIDGDGSKDHGTGFSEKTEAWGNRNLGKELIEANVGEDCKINAYPPDPELTIETDLVLSLKSWGHHYPVGVYLDLVKRSLKPKGRVIMDIRRKTNGKEVMEENGFRGLAMVYESPKCERIVFER